MKQVLMLTFATVYVGQIVYAKSKVDKLELSCTKQSEADVDVVFGRMSGYGNVSRTFPSNEAELAKYCK